ncbi:MAG: DUF3750 domain-containing protein [Gammaproteobacteria bacterium]|jgi:hypothetical protein
MSQAQDTRRRRRSRGALLGRGVLYALLAIGLMLLGPLGVLALGDLDLDTHWSAASRESSGQAPKPETTPEAVLQVYGARTYSWRGAFGIHTWIAAKREGAAEYSTWHVLGWNLRRGRPVVSTSRGGPADAFWFNARPVLLASRSGPGVEALIDRVEEAVAAYPWPDRYRAWPGPNSNTFTAFVARRIPELGLDLPPTAIGKDWLPAGSFLERTPSGSGWQLSVYGLLGIAAGRVEGLELNLLGLNAGLDFDDPALRLPGIGKLGPGG